MMKTAFRLFGRGCVSRLNNLPPRLTRSAASTASPTAEEQARPEAADAASYVPRRACLYIPGHEEGLMRKIGQLGVDCAVLDCEEGVPVDKKEEARSTIRRMLDEVDFGRTEPIVRINSIDSGLAEDDLKAVMQAKRLPQTIMLPNVEQPDHIDWFEARIMSTLKALKIKTALKFSLLMFTESAAGLMRLVEVCRRAEELAEFGTGVQLAGIVFGADNYCASIGAERTHESREVMYARQKVVIIAKAFQLQAIDLSYSDPNDVEGLMRQCLEGASWGFSGKQITHPNQVEVVQGAFSPSPARVQWATELIAAFEEHEKSGQGAFSFRGSMIDRPLVLQARYVVESAKLLPAAPPPPPPNQ